MDRRPLDNTFLSEPHKEVPKDKTWALPVLGSIPGLFYVGFVPLTLVDARMSLRLVGILFLLSIYVMPFALLACLVLGIARVRMNDRFALTIITNFLGLLGIVIIVVRLALSHPSPHSDGW